MSKSKDSDSEIDIYGDLPNFSADNTISELENAKKNLENELRALKLKLKDIQIENDKLKKENEALSINISSLYKTAACEIKRKDQMIQELRKEKDAILFRRQRNQTKRHSYRLDARPAEDAAQTYDTQSEEVVVIYDHPSVDNDVSVIEDNTQYSYNNYSDYQHGEHLQYEEDEVIATFPEEENHLVQNTPPPTTLTIFSKRKAAQQLVLALQKSQSLKYSTTVNLTPEDPVTVIEDNSKTQSAVSHTRKSQTVKTHNEQDIPKVTVKVDTVRSPALEDDVFAVNKKSSSITAGNKNIDLSHKRTETSTSKHLDSARKTDEANKTSSKVKELPLVSLKSTQSSIAEEVKVSRTKSHKSKEHSISHSEKHSHVSSKQKKSDSHTHSHRKSSSSSKFSTHSPSHKSPAKNSLSPRSPKGRSIRETSVSRALKSLRSKSQLKDLDVKSSKSKKERHRDKEDRKKRESREHKKADHNITNSQVSSKLLPEKSQPELQRTDTQLVTENVCKKSVLAPDAAKTVIASDANPSSSVNHDICTKTKNYNEKQTHSQQERLGQSSEKEYNTQTNTVSGASSVSFEESIEMQTDKTLHKEESSKTQTVLSEDISEVQRNAFELKQKASSEVLTDRETLCDAIPTNNSVLFEEHINQTSHISQKDDVSKNSGSSHSETPMDTDLPLNEMPAGNREVIEKVVTDDEHKEGVSEKLPDKNVLHKESVSEEITDSDPMQKEDVAVDSLTSAKERHKASDDSSATTKTTLLNDEADSSVVDSSSMTPVELKTWTENTRGAEALQDSVATSQDDVMPAEKSDVSTNMHIEEDNALSSCHEESKLPKSFHFENLQNEAMKDGKRKCSIDSRENFEEIEPVDRPIGTVENDQNVVSSTLQTDVEERSTTSGVSAKQPISEERNEDRLLNNKDANTSSLEVVSEAPAVEKEQTKSVSQSLPNPNESLSPTATFKKGNVSFAVMNEPGSFRRRKLKRIISNSSNNTVVSNVIKKASDQHLHTEKLSGTKRPYEHTNTERPVSPPAKKQAFADPQSDQLHPVALKDNSVEDCSQAYLESSNTQANEKNPSVTDTNTSNDKNNTSDLEEGEIEDDSDEKTSESNQLLNKDMQVTKVVKAVICTESKVRKEQPRKYLELGRKVRENRRKPLGSHLQEVARGSRDKHHLPNKLFSHCKRRSPSELLIKDRNIKKGIKERDSNSRSRSTSSETAKNTNELNKNERFRERYRTKENKVDTKSNRDREEVKDKAEASDVNSTKENKIGTKSNRDREEVKDKAEASVLQNMHLNKPKDLSAWTRLGKISSSEDRSGHVQSSRKENTVTHNDIDRDSFKIPEVSKQTMTPISKYIIKRKKVCNLQDNVSVPVVNISPPKPITIARSESVNESCKSAHLKTVAASRAGLQASHINLISPSQSKEMVMSKTPPSTSRPRVSQTSVNHSRKSAGISSVRACKTLTSQVSSGSSACTSSSSSSSEYENNSDETWNPRRRRKKKTRRNPKTEVTKSKVSEIKL